MANIKKKILVVLPDYFFPLNSGGHLRTYYLLKSLVSVYDITVICRAPECSNLPDDPINDQIHFVFVHNKPDSRRGYEHYCTNFRNIIWRKTPRIWVFRYKTSFAHALKKTLHRHSFELVMFEHSYMAMYAPLVSQLSAAKKVLVAHNCEWVNYERILKNAKLTPMESILGKIQLFLIKRREAQLYRNFDTCIAVSDSEKSLWQQLNNNKLQVEVIENGTDTTAYRPQSCQPEPATLLFVGSLGYYPNKDAVMYFVNEIFPLIVDSFPGVKLNVVGRGTVDDIYALESRGVHIVGEVEDVKPYLQRATVSVCPLRVGGGTRLKILESFAAGVPMVSTTIGAEGLLAEQGKHIQIADGTQEFANAVVDLLKNGDKRQSMIELALDLAKQKYDWAELGQRQNELLGKLIKNERETVS